MKTISFIADQPLPGQPLTPTLTLPGELNPLPQLAPVGTAPGESLRHILLGSPDAIRQTIHLLHTLHYIETILWSPVLSITEPMVITPAQAEAISLVRKQL